MRPLHLVATPLALSTFLISKNYETETYKILYSVVYLKWVTAECRLHLNKWGCRFLTKHMLSRKFSRVKFHTTFYIFLQIINTSKRWLQCKKGNSSYLFRYNPHTDQWTTVASMSVPRDAVGICVLGGKLYACGGYDGKQYVTSLW